MLDSQRSVASVVLDHSASAAVFHRHRIDFCCRGQMTIEAVCLQQGIDTQALLRELTDVIAARVEEGVDARALSTSELVAHIAVEHHGFLRQALPFVQTMAAKVARVHGEHNPRLRELDAVVRELVETLTLHLDYEERTLFPALNGKPTDLAWVERELLAMKEEHLAVSDLLQRVRQATEDFSLPDWACNSYRTLFAELEHIERDTFSHVHLENHVLMPRFAAK